MSISRRALFGLGALVFSGEARGKARIYRRRGDRAGRTVCERAREERRLLDTPLLTAYVSSIVKRLGAKSERLGMTFTAKVVDTDAVDTANLPGGFIFVNRGLLDFVETESQLAGALAHDVGHIAGHHGTQELYEKVKQAALAKDKTMGQIVDRLGGALAMMRLLRYTREDEVAADRLGFHNMIRAGWNPRGLLNLMERISRLAGDSSSPADPRADHPSAAERCAAFREEMKRVRDADSLTENSLSFRVMKIGLKLHGPAPSR